MWSLLISDYGDNDDGGDDYDDVGDVDVDGDDDDEAAVSFQEFQEGGIQRTARQPSWSHLGLWNNGSKITGTALRKKLHIALHARAPLIGSWRPPRQSWDVLGCALHCAAGICAVLKIVNLPNVWLQSHLIEAQCQICGNFFAIFNSDKKKRTAAICSLVSPLLLNDQLRCQLWLSGRLALQKKFIVCYTHQRLHRTYLLLNSPSNTD